MAFADEDVTPLHGVPLPDFGEEYAPKHIDVESSERMSAALHSNASGNGELSPEKFLEALIEKLAGAGVVPKDGGGGDEPPKPFTSADGYGWARKLIGGIAALGIFLVTWYNTVNRDLENKATHDEVKQAVDSKLSGHEGATHPDTAVRLKSLEREQRTIRDSQIRQETIDTVQTTTLKEIRDDVRRLRFRRR